MANVKISELPAAATLDGTEEIPVVQAAGTAKATVADILGAISDADIPAAIARDTEVATAVTNHEAAGNPHPTYHTAAEVATDIATHAADTTAIHGITDTSVLETTTGSAAKVATHQADTTAVHGITDTADLVVTSDSRLTDSRAPNGAAGGVLSGTYPNPGFAADMATQAELDAHAHTGTYELVGVAATADATHVAAADPHTGYVLESLIDAAGDLLVGTADNTVGRLAKGSALQVLRVNSGATALEYADPSGGSVLGVYGDGSDGVINFDGTTTVLGITPAGGTYTLARDVYLAGGSQVSGTANVYLANYRIFCNGTFTIGASAVVHNDGLPASGTTGGTATTAGTVPANGAGSSGVAGAASGATTATTNNIGGSGGVGGAASGGGTGGGSTAVLAMPAATASLPRGLANAFGDTTAVRWTGGRGGRGGTAAASSTGGGGGAAGSVVYVVAYTLVVSGVLRAAGGTGGAASGSGTGAGGGGGGGGGVLILVYHTKSGAGSTFAAATNVPGGTGGAPQGAGATGATGSNGNIYEIVN